MELVVRGVRSSEKFYTNIGVERRGVDTHDDGTMSALTVLNPREGDVIFKPVPLPYRGGIGSTDCQIAGFVYEKGNSFTPWNPVKYKIFKSVLKRVSVGLDGYGFEGTVYFMDESVLKFAYDEWPWMCQLLAGQISLAEFKDRRRELEIVKLQKRVEELGKLARSYDDERRRFAEAISTAARGLHDTRRFVKSSRIQKIREDLEAVLRG